MANDSAILGSGVTNPTPGSIAQAKATYDADLLLLDPKNQTVVVIPKENAKAFMQEANQMASLCNSLTQSRESLLVAEEKLAALLAQPFPSLGEIKPLENHIKQLRKAYDEAYAGIKKELGDKGYLATAGNGKELLELMYLYQMEVHPYNYQLLILIIV